MVRVHRSELLVRQRLAALERTLPPARGGQVEAIHQARVATRRLREALPLVTRGAGGRKLMKRVRRVTRALGPIRELDVALLTLDELRAGPTPPTRGIDVLAQVVTEERQRLFADLARQIDHTDLERIRKKALAAVREDGVGRAGADADRLDAALRRASRRAASLRAAIENAGGMYLPDRLHLVRIAVKKLRYGMEIARELSRSRATARIRVLKGAQDILGRLHDLEVLIIRIRALQGSDRAPTLRVSAELDRLVRQLETDCRQLHVRYMSVRPSLLHICDHVTAADEKRRAPAA